MQDLSVLAPQRPAAYPMARESKPGAINSGFWSPTYAEVKRLGPIPESLGTPRSYREGGMGVIGRPQSGQDSFAHILVAVSIINCGRDFDRIILFAVAGDALVLLALLLLHQDRPVSYQARFGTRCAAFIENWGENGGGLDWCLQ